MFSPNCPNPTGRSYLHGPPPPLGAGAGRFVAQASENDARRIEAWRRLAALVSPPCRLSQVESYRTRIRQRLLEPVMACAGALLGWCAPLLVKQAVPAAGAALYECTEGVLYPLFAFIGGGIGIACGNAWAALRTGGGKSRP